MARTKAATKLDRSITEVSPLLHGATSTWESGEHLEVLDGFVEPDTCDGPKVPLHKTRAINKSATKAAQRSLVIETSLLTMLENTIFYSTPPPGIVRCGKAPNDPPDKTRVHNPEWIISPHHQRHAIMNYSKRFFHRPLAYS